MTASFGGFSPTKNWWPQNSSFLSSNVLPLSAGSIENSVARRRACAAVYSWIGDR